MKKTSLTKKRKKARKKHFLHNIKTTMLGGHETRKTQLIMYNQKMVYNSKISQYSQPSVKPTKKDAYTSGNIGILLLETGFNLLLEKSCLPILIHRGQYNDSVSPYSAGN